MPYIVVTGSLTSPGLITGDDTVVLGLNNEERTRFVQDMNASLPNTTKVNDQLKCVSIRGKGLSLSVVNRLHGLLGYDVISHSMALNNTNQERMSWTMYKKSRPPSRPVTAHRSSDVL